MAHHCEAIVVTCMDFRLQGFFEKWLNETIGPGQYDRVSYAGGVKNWEAIFPQIEISRRLHGIKKVVLINHEDCGAYGEEGNPKRHADDLRAARTKVIAVYPDLTVESYYATLDGHFERVY